MIQESVSNVFRIACLNGCVKGVMHEKMVYACCVFRVLCWYIRGLMWALESREGKCFRRHNLSDFFVQYPWKYPPIKYHDMST